MPVSEDGLKDGKESPDPQVWIAALTQTRRLSKRDSHMTF